MKKVSALCNLIQERNLVNTSTKKSVFKRVITGLNLFSKKSANQSQNIQTNEAIAENVKEFIEDNAIYVDDDSMITTNNDQLTLTLNFQCKDLIIKLKNRPSEITSFTFLYIKLEDLRSLFLNYTTKRDISLMIKSLDITDKITINKRCMTIFTQQSFFYFTLLID